MRRRSEAKKSSSPAPLPARRSRRSRKISENEKTEDEAPLVEKKSKADDARASSIAPPIIIEEINEEQQDAGDEQQQRASSEERAASPVRKSRSSRTIPKKRNSVSNQRDKSENEGESERKVETIPEELENGSEASTTTNTLSKTVDIDKKLSDEKETVKKKPTAVPDDVELQGDPQKQTGKETEIEEPKGREEDEVAVAENAGTMDQSNVDGVDEEGRSMDKGKTKDLVEERSIVEEVKVASSLSFTANKDVENLKPTSDVLEIQADDVESGKPAAAEHKAEVETGEAPKAEQPKKDSIQLDEQKENHKDKEDQTADQQAEKQESGTQQRSVRKRRWLSKKVAERAPPVLAISTDSLKNIIADVVNPVPLSDVQLESSSEEEGLVTSDHETDDGSMTPEMRVTKVRDEGNASDEEQHKPQQKPQPKSTNDRETPMIAATNKSAAEPAPNAVAASAASASTSVPHSPSPARNRASHVLYITNLVRPFTVLQLKGLLARTGKIVDDDGFWIDRIKSKCYVAYATEDEAIETRHALHGVRWPVSNPKCLNVDFGSRTDMDRAIQSTKNEAPKYPQDNTRDNQNSSNTWSRLDASEKKPARPVREWDVGKKEPNERDKTSNDRRRSSKERVDSRLRESDRGKTGDEAERAGQDRKRSRERDRGGRERERERDRTDHHGHGRSRSASPEIKSRKKENEPPIRLLDDLFRKTKGTPCIYWLPLTPEAIAEKEVFRQKRIEEHKQRIKEREERLKEREKDRDRQRDTRRNRSNERRRSRSRERERERRRY